MVEHPTFLTQDLCLAAYRRMALPQMSHNMRWVFLAEHLAREMKWEKARVVMEHPTSQIQDLHLAAHRRMALHRASRNPEDIRMLGKQERPAGEHHIDAL